MEINWTRIAKITYFEILENLNERWTEKQMTDFQNLTEELFSKIQNKEIICPYIYKKLKIRKGIVHKNVSVFYKEDKKDNKIQIITFFNNQMDPKTLKELLSKI